MSPGCWRITICPVFYPNPLHTHHPPINIPQFLKIIFSALTTQFFGCFFSIAHPCQDYQQFSIKSMSHIIIDEEKPQGRALFRGIYWVTTTKLKKGSASQQWHHSQSLSCNIFQFPRNVLCEREGQKYFEFEPLNRCENVKKEDWLLHSASNPTAGNFLGCFMIATAQQMSHLQLLCKWYT